MIKRTHTYNNFLSGRGHSPKIDPSVAGGGGQVGGGCTPAVVYIEEHIFPGITLFTQNQGVQYVYLVPADTHISQPDENTISPSQQIYPCGTPILRNTSVGYPCKLKFDRNSATEPR